MAHFLPIPIRDKHVIVSRGDFTCPKCRAPRRYEHREQTKRYLVFLFFPILGDVVAEYVECAACRARFPLTVLRQGLATEQTQILQALREKLERGAAIEEVETQLQSSGIDLGTIKQYISVAAGIGRKKCPECELTYRKNVPNCARCSHRLPEAPKLVK